MAKSMLGLICILITEKKEVNIMNEQEILQVFKNVGAIITNSHIVYTSGKHGTAYVNKDAIYPYTRKTSDLCRIIAKQFVDDSVEVVIAPATGSIVLSQWIAYHLSEITGREVLGVYAEKAERLGSVLWYICFGLRLLCARIPQLGQAPKEYFVIKRGYDKFIAGKNILVVDDVLATGGSAKKVIKATRALGGNIVGLGVLCNRGGITPQDVADPPKLFALVNIKLVNVKLDAWNEAECPLCAKNVPINTDIGKGREYLARKKG